MNNARIYREVDYINEANPLKAMCNAIESVEGINADEMYKKWFLGAKYLNYTFGSKTAVINYFMGLITVAIS